MANVEDGEGLLREKIVLSSVTVFPLSLPKFQYMGSGISILAVEADEKQVTENLCVTNAGKLEHYPRILDSQTQPFTAAVVWPYLLRHRGYNCSPG